MARDAFALQALKDIPGNQGNFCFDDTCSGSASECPLTKLTIWDVRSSGHIREMKTRVVCCNSQVRYSIASEAPLGAGAGQKILVTIPCGAAALEKMEACHYTTYPSVISITEMGLNQHVGFWMPQARRNQNCEGQNFKTVQSRQLAINLNRNFTTNITGPSKTKFDD